MEEMNNELTIDYIADFLKGRGYEIYEWSITDTVIGFKANESNWSLYIDPKGCFTLKQTMSIDSVGDFKIFAESLNATNEYAWLVKSYMHYEQPVDDEGNPIADVTKTMRLVTFSCEHICTRKADFEKYFDMFIGNISAAADFLGRDYLDRMDFVIREEVPGCDNFGVKYSCDGKQLVYAFYQLEEYEIRDGVTEICNNAFAEQEKLKHIVIPEGVTKIGVKAFFRCYSLETITLPKSLQEIGYCAFGALTRLKKIYVPKGIHGKFAELERDYGNFFVERDE